eukprot:12355689-Ditylum_brightwellii.AAC.1
MDSNSGHVFVDGSLTGLPIIKKIYVKQCQVCETFDGGKESAPAHKCSKIVGGSSKSMETRACIDDDSTMQ